MIAIKPERVFKSVEALAGVLIAAIWVPVPGVPSEFCASVGVAMVTAAAAPVTVRSKFLRLKLIAFSREAFALSCEAEVRRLPSDRTVS